MAVATVLAVGMGAAVPIAQAGPRRAVDARQLEIVIESSDADTRESIERRIRKGVEQAIGLFEEYQKQPLDRDARVRVRVTPFAGDEVGYGVAVEGLLVGQVIEDSPEPFECPACTETELVDRVVEEVGLLLPKLQPPADEPGPEPTATEPTAEPEPTTEDEPADDPAPAQKRLGPLGWAGVGLLAGGAVGVGVGLGLGLREDTLAEDMPEPNDVEVISTRTAGWAVLGVGAAVLVTGAVLLVFDLKRQKGRTTRLSPLPLRAGGGMGLTTRF